MTFLTERQAWTRIAEAFARYETTGKHETTRKRETLTKRGLCHALYCLRTYIEWRTYASMAEKIWDTVREHRYGEGSVFLCPCTRRSAGLRAMLATLFAEDAAE